jgi:lipoprotein-anchoring transpeptidase ErfK/SrfK
MRHDNRPYRQELLRMPTRSLTRLVLGFATAAIALAGTAAAAPPKKKYHFELTTVTAKSDVKPDVAKAATSRIEAQVKKVFSGHPQLVAHLDAAPDPRTNADGYRKYLAKKLISGAYLVGVEITDASEELVPLDDKPNSQRLVIHIAIHMLGENIPGRTMGFTGDGKATIKQEVGMKIRDRDREYTWDQAAEIAVDDAMKTVFQQLAIPPKKQ